MDRIDAFGGSPVGTLTNGHPGFVDENLSIGQEGTLVPGAFLSAVQEEIANLIEAAGLTLDAADYTQLTAAVRAFGAHWVRIFATPGSFTCTPPTIAWTANVLVMGAGGPGGRGNGGAGAGGQAGSLAYKAIAFAPGSTFSVVVGAGGTAAVGGGSATAGGSSAAAGMTAPGGTAGGQGNPGTASDATSPSSSPSGGLLNFNGTQGQFGVAADSGWVGGQGGGNAFGPGAISPVGASGHDAAGIDAFLPGTGGSGGVGASAGGNGAAGIVIFWG